MILKKYPVMRIFPCRVKVCRIYNQRFCHEQVRFHQENSWKQAWKIGFPHQVSNYRYIGGTPEIKTLLSSALMNETASHTDIRPGLNTEKWPWKSEHPREEPPEGPGISVITPSFNQVEYIEATMLSVLNQPCANLEYLVVDGGSKDGSVGVIQPYREQLAWFESEPDRGQADAINKGINRAAGEWIAFINSDDFFLPGALATITRHIRQTRSRWIAAGIQVLGDDGKDYGERYPEVENPDDLQAWLTYRNQVPQQGCFIHRSVFNEIGLFDADLHYAFDLDFWIRLITAGICPDIVREPVAVFRIQDESKSMSGRLPFIKDHRRILRKHRASLSGSEFHVNTRKLNKMEAGERIYSAANHAECNNRTEAVRQLKKALRLRKTSSLKRPFWGAVKRIIGGR